MTIYDISKLATKGIRTHHRHKKHMGTFYLVLDTEGNIREWVEEKYVFTSKAEAIEGAKILRVKRIKALEDQIARLKSLVFEGEGAVESTPVSLL